MTVSAQQPANCEVSFSVDCRGMWAAQQYLFRHKANNAIAKVNDDATGNYVTKYCDVMLDNRFRAQKTLANFYQNESKRRYTNADKDFNHLNKKTSTYSKIFDNFILRSLSILLATFCSKIDVCFVLLSEAEPLTVGNF